MTREQMMAAFNEWMRRFIEEPDRFKREFEEVQLFAAEEAAGTEPTYGQECTAYMEKLVAEAGAAG